MKLLKSFLFGGINYPPKCPNIEKMVILGANFYPQIKFISEKLFLLLPDMVLTFKYVLVEYSMNILSDLIRYFVNMVIFIKKYMDFRSRRLIKMS